MTFDLAVDPRDALRMQWRRLVSERLPSAAAFHPHWPIRADHCFARVILDVVCDGPWRHRLPAPVWKHMSESQLRAAIDLAEAILSGEADLSALNRSSLDARSRAAKLSTAAKP